ncbi:hypothetical protein LXL04_009623 [Taraxacum kok-saghyz]
MVLTMWNVRFTNEHQDVNAIYNGYPTMFSLQIHHGGEFSKFPGRQYVNGTYSYIDFLDADEFSVHELNSMMQQLGYGGNRKLYYHFKKPGSDLDTGLLALGTDNDVCKLTSYVPKHRLLEVYIEVDRTKVQTCFQSPLGSNVMIQEIEYDDTPNQDDEPDCEDGFDASDEEYGSKDDDFSADEEDLLQDVEVDMNDFHVNIDINSEWIESKSNLIDVTHEDNLNIDILDNEDFDSNSEGEEAYELRLSSFEHNLDAISWIATTDIIILAFWHIEKSTQPERTS